jgi:3'-phosphoadenosine 5'-phosphosulfate sulfotransferase (PAPS reductase)/FAD synthetase
MNSTELNKKIREITGDTVILMFSCGKDAICSYYELKKYFKNVITVYQYLHPDLSFINEQIKYFEEKFNQKIYKIPHVSVYRMINDHVFQPPETSDIIDAVALPNHKYEHYYEWIREDFNVPNVFVATGVRVADSPLRRMSIKIHSPINKKKKSFFPIFDWTNDDIRKCLKENKIKLPIDYEMFGKSFDGLCYRYIKPIKEKFPEDYNKLKNLYPLIDLEILRYDGVL